MKTINCFDLHNHVLLNDDDDLQKAYNKLYKEFVKSFRKSTEPFLNVCSRGSIVAPSEGVPLNILNQKALLVSIKPPLEDDAKMHSPLFLITRKQGIKNTQF